MDRRQLEIFHTTATARSFTRAAVQLHMAQPAVSIAIAKLEQSLNCQLFDRSQRQIELTPEGHQLLLHAEQILLQFQQARTAIKELADGSHGEIKLCSPAMLGSYVLADSLAQFRRQHPGIQLQWRAEGTGRASELLQQGRVDLAVVNTESLTAELNAAALWQEEIVVCVAADDPLAQYRDITVEQLCRQPLIVYPPGYYLRSLLERLCCEQQLSLDIAVETDLLRPQFQFIRQRLGLGICLRRVLDSEPGLVAIPFRQPQFIALGIGYRRDRYLSRASRALLTFLGEQ